MWVKTSKMLCVGAEGLLVVPQRLSYSRASGAAAAPLCTFLLPGYATWDGGCARLLGMEWPQRAVSVGINQAGKVTRTITWPSMTLNCDTQGSISPPFHAVYHRRCPIVKMGDMQDRDVSGTVWTAREMAHRRCCYHDSREKTENTTPQRLN